MGGRPSRNTPKDMRLKANKPTVAKPATVPVPKPKPKPKAC